MIAALVPPCLGAHEEVADDPGEKPFPGEGAQIAQAVPARRREFITARRCARRALSALGHPAVTIPSGKQRELR
ncbi:hypothetical protein [Pilimelia columellifera]|uniref:hypothetical protein n=1 Tax=Pilimelia columellifera TaxID=706574 RepID=UPI0031DACDF5